MTRFDFIAHTGAIKEYRGFYQPMRLSPECKRALRNSMPTTWADALLTVVGVTAPPAVVIGFAVLFVRWWLCL